MSHEDPVIFNVHSSEEILPKKLLPAQQLMVLPENTRYLQYKGLPFVGFYHKRTTNYWKSMGAPGMNHRTKEQIRSYAEYGNYCLQWFWHFPNSFNTLYEGYLTNNDYWEHVREVCREAYRNDYVLIISMWHVFWMHDKQEGKWGYGDMVWDLDHPKLKENLEPYGLPGMTRMDLHKLAIRKMVEYTWEFPNIVYDFAFEYGLIPIHGDVERDKGGDFYRWWADTIREEGKKVNPGIQHLLSIMFGGETIYCAEYGLEGKNDFAAHMEMHQHPFPPGSRHADILLGEAGWIGFQADPALISEEVYSWKVPMMRMACMQAARPNGKHEGIQDVDVGSFVHQLIKTQIVNGIMTGEPYWGVTEKLRNWMLQCRWYLENIRTWEDEPGGDEINLNSLPVYKECKRPKLLNPYTYGKGLSVCFNRILFEAVYKDPEGNPPALAEVWIDLNGDGRFDPNPLNGERITMKPSGTEYMEGVLFSSTCDAVELDGKTDLRFIYRFANKYWYPPEPGGLIPDNTRGISYNHWVLPDFSMND